MTARYYLEERIVRDWNGTVLIKSTASIPYDHEDAKAIRKELADDKRRRKSIRKWVLKNSAKHTL